MAGMGKSFEEFCTQFSANPPPWLRAEIDRVEAGDGEGSLQLSGKAAPERFNSRLSSLDITPLAEALRGDTSVAEVNLGYNLLDHTGATALGRMLQHNSTVASLNVEFNDIDGPGGKEIATALAACPSLKRLIVRGNAMGDSAVVSIARAVHSSSLELLDISNTDAGTCAVIAMAMVLEHDDVKLKYLYMARALLDECQSTTSVALGRMLKLNTSLLCLDLSGNNMTDDDAELVVRNLKLNTSLKSLSLAGNKLRCKGGALFAEYLAGNSSLEELDLSHNWLTDLGVEGLDKALAANSTLSFLGLASTHLGGYGLCTVADGVASNAGLRRLNLWGNGFERESSSAFMALVGSHSASLDTDFRPYEVDGEVLIAECRD